MTREQAIMTLIVVDENATCDDCLYYNQMEDCPNDEDCIIRQAIDMAIKALEQEPKTGHWSRKTKVDAYDIAGVKTWGIKCQCDRCDFTTIVVEDFGYYKYCPNCGCRMIEPQESEDKDADKKCTYKETGCGSCKKAVGLSNRSRYIRK